MDAKGENGEIWIDMPEFSTLSTEFSTMQLKFEDTYNLVYISEFGKTQEFCNFSSVDIFTIGIFGGKKFPLDKNFCL